MSKMSVRYAPRVKRAGAPSPSRLFLHSASLCVDFIMREPSDALGGSKICNLRALAELPLQLKQRLAELGIGEQGLSVDAEVAAASGLAIN
jgi:hypothetical protein